MTNSIIARQFGEIQIGQKVDDGYINATAMCQAANKKLNDYTRLGSTKEFLDELSNDTGIPVSALVKGFKGGDPKNQGTWVHPDVAINLAQWVSPKFAVQVSKWVREWMTTGKNPISKVTDSPYTKRLKQVATDLKCPKGHWCVIQQSPALLCLVEKLYPVTV